ncbi:MAG: hypothetical protein V8R40_07280 [Dysosmobacter sp.]
MDHQTFESRYQVYRQAVEAYLEGLFASIAEGLQTRCGTAFWRAASASARC